MDRHRILSCVVLSKSNASAEQALTILTEDSDFGEVQFSTASVEGGPVREADVLVIHAVKGNDFDGYDLGMISSLPFKYVYGSRLASIAVAAKLGAIDTEREELTAENLIQQAVEDRFTLNTCLKDWYNSFEEFSLSAIESKAATNEIAAFRGEFANLFGFLPPVRYEEFVEWVYYTHRQERGCLYRLLKSFAKTKVYFPRLMLLINGWSETCKGKENANCKYLLYHNPLDTSTISLSLGLKSATSQSLSVSVRFRAIPDCNFAEAQRLLEYQIRKLAGFTCSLNEECNTAFDAMTLQLSRSEDYITADFTFNPRDKKFSKLQASLEDYLILFNLSRFEQSLSVSALFNVDIESLTSDNLHLFEPFIENFRILLSCQLWKGNSCLLKLLNSKYSFLSQLFEEADVETEINYYALTEREQAAIISFLSVPKWAEFKRHEIFTKLNKKVNLFKSFSKTLNDYFVGEVHLTASLLHLHLEMSLLAHGLNAISPFS